MTEQRFWLDRATPITLGIFLLLGGVAFILAYHLGAHGAALKKKMQEDKMRFVAITDRGIEYLRAKNDPPPTLGAMKVEGVISDAELKFLNRIGARYFPPQQGAPSNTIVFAFTVSYLVHDTTNSFGGWYVRTLDGRVRRVSDGEVSVGLVKPRVSDGEVSAGLVKP